MEEVDADEGALDPRIQIELENLNTATDEINRLEIKLDEANTTFRILLNDCTRRLKLKSKSVGSCIERARPYYEALDVARQAQLECQRAAVQYQRSNEIHQAAKETVALAEQRFLSKQHEWQFDNAWQEMLNHATIKVRDAETQKAESGREHHKRAVLFNAAEQKVQQLEQRLHRYIVKSRPYFDEKVICNGQLAAQKERIEVLQAQVAAVKSAYATSLKELERISEEIHCKRSRNKGAESEQDVPSGPREPGVGAERSPIYSENALSCEDKNTEVKGQTPNAYDEAKELKICSQGPGQELTVNNEPKTSPGHPSMTSLPLLDNLAMLKNSGSADMLIGSSPFKMLVEQNAAQHIETSSTENEFGEQLRKSTIVNADNLLKRDEEASADGAYNNVLLMHLMETYESELDRCDMASLSSMSVATSSSAVSEKDENEACADEEEIEELEGKVRELSTQVVLSEFSDATSSSIINQPYAQTPTKISQSQSQTLTLETGKHTMNQITATDKNWSSLPSTPLATPKYVNSNSSHNTISSSTSIPTSPVKPNFKHTLLSPSVNMILSQSAVSPEADNSSETVACSHKDCDSSVNSA